MAAAVGPDDDPALHAADTLAAGRGLCRPSAVRLLTEEAPARIAELRRLGVRFDDGLGREGGHSRARVVHAGGADTGTPHRRRPDGAGTRASPDPAGRGRALTTLADAPRLRRRPRHRRLRRALGADDESARRGRRRSPARARRRRRRSPTSSSSSSTRRRFATRTATTASSSPRRSAAPARRCSTTAASASSTSSRRATSSRARSPHAPERASTCGRSSATAIPSLMATLEEAGYDPADEPVPVSPAAHYAIGGIVTDLDGRTTVPGLYAAGECACTGVHGANRLASNSLLECLVFGRRAGLAALDGPRFDNACDNLSLADVCRDPGAALWRDAGLIRSAAGLAAAARLAAPARPRDRRLRARAGGEPRRPLPRGLPGRERGARRASRRPSRPRAGAGAMELTQDDIDRVVAAALAEDVGSGDATTLALVPEDARCRAELLLEEPGVVCGVPVAAAVFRALDPAVHVEAKLEEGTAVSDVPAVARRGRGAGARDPQRRARRAQPARPALRHRLAHPPLRRADRGNAARPSSTPARRRPACARSRSTPSAAAAAATTAPASTTACS